MAPLVPSQVEHAVKVYENYLVSFTGTSSRTKNPDSTSKALAGSCKYTIWLFTTCCCCALGMLFAKRTSLPAMNLAFAAFFATLAGPLSSKLASVLGWWNAQEDASIFSGGVLVCDMENFVARCWKVVIYFPPLIFEFFFSSSHVCLFTAGYFFILCMSTYKLEVNYIFYPFIVA